MSMPTERSPETERRSITLPDGRNADMLIAGPSDGLPLVLHEGTPVRLVLYLPTVRAAQVRGLRVILAARPGYEGSTPRPGRPSSSRPKRSRWVPSPGLRWRERWAGW